ncbi:MAG: flippase-like domain-containing protein [Elusimicrobia bacterium]|nr:flippase-like domain-containing protein [Elusimicrobiota bacterium]
MEKAKTNKLLFIYAPMPASFGILFWLIYPNLDALSATVRNADPKFLLLSFFFACGSYLFMGFSLWEILKILGHRLPFWEASGVAFVSTTVNYFFSSGGVSGFATRAHLLNKRQIPYGICVTSSVVLSVLIYLMLSIIIVEGMFLQLLKTHPFGVKFFEGIVGVMFVLSFAFALVMLFFHHELRSAWARKIYHAVNHVLFFFSKKEIPEETFVQFEEQLAQGINTIHAKKYELPKVLGFVCLDWICTIMILNFAFRAVGVNMGTAKLIIGFAAGMLMTVIPVLPGGLGAMEAAMSAVYSQMGVNFGKALTAALIFRLFYYVAPSIISVFIYWGLKMSEPDYAYFGSASNRLPEEKEEDG